MKTRFTWTSVVVLFLPILCACGGDKPSTPEPAKPAKLASPVEAAPGSTAADVAEAKELFAGRCTPCHGTEGGGDGPASAGLTPKPAKLNSAEWQASVTDEHIEKIIQLGGAAVGKSPAMPPNPDLMEKVGTVKALRAHIRSLKK